MAEKVVNINRELLAKIRSEYEEGLDYMESRRDVFHDRLKMYNNQKKDEEMVGIMTMYTLINTILSVYYSDKLTVSFSSRKLDNLEIMSNLNALAEFDHDEMQLGVKDYFTQWDRTFYGVGIRIFEDWDRDRLCPTVRTISPLHWIPDPYGNPETHFRYHGFELVVDKDEFTAENGYDMKAVEKLSPASPDHEAVKNIKAEKEAQDVNTGAMDALHENAVSVYHHYTFFKGKKYLVTTDSALTNVLRVIELTPVGTAEKRNPLLIPYPVILNYFSPMRNSPLGTSVSDIVEDKQRLMSVMANLKIKRAKSLLYPMGIYNAKMIKNKRDLDFGFNKNIPAHLKEGEALSNAYMPLKRDYMDTTADQVMEFLENEARKTTGADYMQSGMMSATARTLGEVQQVQANANLRFLLNSRVNAWGEKDFWKYWYREYKDNFTPAQKKVVRVTSPNSSQFIELTRTDFLAGEDPDISILSRLEDERKRDKESTEYMNSLSLLLQDPTISQAERRNAKRLYYMKKGYSSEEIDMILPKNADELDAEQENLILSQNQPVEIEGTDDHASHMIIHTRAQNTEQTRWHIAKHKLALIQTGEAKGMNMMAGQAAMEQNKTLSNMSQNQIGNRLSQQLTEPSGGVVQEQQS